MPLLPLVCIPLETYYENFPCHSGPKSIKQRLNDYHVIAIDMYSFTSNTEMAQVKSISVMGSSKGTNIKYLNRKQIGITTKY